MFFYAAAKQAVEPIIDVVLKSGHTKMLAQILAIKGTYETCVEEDFPKAFDHLEKSLRICEELKDNASLAIASWRLGLTLSMNCEFEKAAQYFEKALNILMAANNPWGISVAKSYLSHFAYYFAGKFNLAYQTSEEALNLAEESDDIYSKAMAYTVHGSSCYAKGFFEDATQHLLKGVGLSEKIDLFIWNALANMRLGEVYYEIGEYRNSKDRFAKVALILKRSCVYPSMMTTAKLGAAMARVMMNEKDIDLESLYVHVYENKMKNLGNYKLRYIGEILLNIDDQHLPEAEDWIKKAIEAHKRDGMMCYMGMAYTLYAELFKRKGDALKAKENLNKAIGIFKECGADGWAKNYEKVLAAL